MKWLQVELQLKPELAEPVAELLSRYADGGVAVTSLPQEETDREQQVRVFGYLLDGPVLEEQRRKIEEGLWHLGQIQPLPPASFEWVEQIYWAEAWKFHFHPITVGDRFLIQPSWIDPEPTERLILRMNPGMAFGTGSHPSTQLSLELIESHLEPGQVVADLGSGSGILSLAAILLGAERVLAIDISEDAVAAGRRNSRLNGVESGIEFLHGSLDELLALLEEGLAPDVIVVNILAAVIDGFLSAGLGAAIPAGSTLILAGILEEQGPALLETAAEFGLHLIEERSHEDWVAYALSRNPPQ